MKDLNLKLYVLPGSHPCLCVEKALEIKGLPFKRVDLIPGMHVAVAKLLFGKRTVPALKGDGFTVSGSRQILKVLDALAPEPALLPEDPDLRSQVQEAERWGDEVFQSSVRTIDWPLFGRNRDAMASYAQDANLPIPLSVAMKLAGPVIKFEQKLNGTSEEKAQQAVAELPAHLEQIDNYVKAGVICGEKTNSADLQIGSTLAVLNSVEDLKPLISSSSAYKLTELFQVHGSIPAGTMPAQWLDAVAK